MKFDLGHVEVRKRSRLPHWHVEHGIQFVTFNLIDSLPRHARDRIHEEAAAQASMIRRTHGELTMAEKLAIQQWVDAKIGDSLDDSHGSCFMRDARIAQIVANAITYFDEQRYRLFAFVVMPNHVHVVLTLFRAEGLDGVVHSWKSFTAKQANRALARTGAFWHEDYYNRVIRDSRELAATIEYVLANPGKAGLADWEFVRVYPERMAAFVPPSETPGGWRAGRPPY